MMQKVRNQAFPCGHSPLPACRHTISGSLNSPHRGSFHLSLTVLVHYRSTGSIQAYEMVLADSGRIARVPPYLGTPLGPTPVSTTGLSPSVARLSRRLVYRDRVLNAVPLPRQSFLWRFGLFRFRSPLLAESRLLYFLEVLRCFTSLGSLVRAYELSATYGGITRRGFPHSDIAGSKPG